MTEFVVHPADVDDQLRQLSPPFAEPRAAEPEAPPDPRVLAAVKRRGLGLTGFAALATRKETPP